MPPAAYTHGRRISSANRSWRRALKLEYKWISIIQSQPLILFLSFP
jgi:hypothetical protein